MLNRRLPRATSGRSKKPYRPPTLVRLGAEEMVAKLEELARTGDTVAQQMVERVRESEKKKAEKDSAAPRPTFGLELRLPSSVSEAEVSLWGDHLNSGNLEVVRQYLQLSQDVMQQRGATPISREQERKVS